jgi:hypothetical protein
MGKISTTQEMSTDELITLRNNTIAAQEFAKLAKYVMSQRGSISEAAYAAEHGKLAEVRGLTPRLINILKASTGGREISRELIHKTAAAPSTLGTSSGPFADYSAITNGFTASLQNFGVFDTLLGSARRVPVGTGATGQISTAATAYYIVEGNMKPVSRMSFTGAIVNPLKTVGVIVITQELARSAKPEALTLIQRDLQNAVAVITDATVLAILTSGVSVATSTGATAESVVADADYLFHAVTTDQRSNLFFITTPSIAKTLSVMGATPTSAQRAFPDVTFRGGTLFGVPLLVSDGVTAGQILLVDAGQIEAGSGDIILTSLKDAAVAMDSNPDSPVGAATVFTSLWQNNQTAIVVERYFTCVRPTATAVAAVSNSGSYRTGFSPP